MRSGSQDGEEEMENSNKTALGKRESIDKTQVQINIVNNFSKIIQNLSKNKHIATKLRLK